jgi:hypothetical protein
MQGDDLVRAGNAAWGAVCDGIPGEHGLSRQMGKEEEEEK